ncbi:hypothetical protein PL81_31115 [Streptomyces sp. RSD-27]|nr:hypothetical protein PL81_31115 [Streptomyces sp. RSD-27]
MTSTHAGSEVIRHLKAARHTHSETGPAWQPGFRVSQASPRTVRIHHDGPDEATHLQQYADTLSIHGYYTTLEHRRGKRPALRITRP